VFVAFEGGDGSGKSTQARLLASRLGAVLTFEPGGTALGAELRSLLLDGDDIDPRAEALLMAADRAQHRSEVIKPALDRGVHVVTDRYLYSSLAYQGYGRGLDIEAVHELSRFAGAPEADLVILLTVPASVRRERLRGQLDRIESGEEEFHERIERGFLELAARDPERWVVIVATGSIEDVADLVWIEVRARV
jgi:dTMP kinase